MNRSATVITALLARAEATAPVLEAGLAGLAACSFIWLAILTIVS